MKADSSWAASPSASGTARERAGLLFMRTECTHQLRFFWIIIDMTLLTN
jgi:hypothetical protein